VVGDGDCDDSRQSDYLESIPDASTSAFGGVAATPKRAVQLPLHFDLVGTRPVVKVIQADLSNSWVT